jgi:hypothetical protein
MGNIELLKSNNQGLTNEEEIKRLNIAVNGLMIFVLERFSVTQELTSKELLEQLENSVNRQLLKESESFRSLFI